MSIGFHKAPRFSYASWDSCSQLAPSVIGSYNISSRKEPKMSQLFNNNYNSFNTTNINTTVADNRSNILAWLSPLDPKLRHQDVRECRVGTIGEWVLQTEEFKSWCAGTGSGRAESDKPVLFCHGGPGVGKTYIR